MLLSADVLHQQFTSTSQPSISDAELQEAKNWLGVNLSPEELTSVDISDEMRDRLSRDPRAQPILKALHKDLLSMQVGWNGEKPIWVTYGAKSFPLLDYYTQSNDPVRQRYGMTGIFNLGKPYTTLWLKKQIKRRSHSRPLWDSDIAWRVAFGLDDPLTRAEIIQLARANLNPQSEGNFNLDDPYYYERAGQFNRRLLDNLLSDAEQQQDFEAEIKKRYGVYPEKPDPIAQQEHLKVEQWAKWMRDTKLTKNRIQQLLSAYDNLRVDTQSTIARNLIYVDRSKLAPSGRALLRHVMQDQNSRDRPIAITILTYHRDPTATRLMPEILDGDLHWIDPINSDVNLVLMDILDRYPNSRFVRGCREYGDLTGRSYYGQVLRSDAILRRIEQKTPVQTVADWQDWLNRYPDHPGADDATDQLIRALLTVADSLEATRQAIRLLTLPLGDGDARFRGYRRLRVLLDIGLTTDQLRSLLDDPESKPLLPLLRYALAVHLARDQQYAEAITTSNGINLARMPHGFFRDYFYFNDEDDLGVTDWKRKALIQSLQQMQAMLIEQRQQWQQLQQLQVSNTAESRYQIASQWAAKSGWKLGYLGLWNERRWTRLPTINTWDYLIDSSRNLTEQRRDRFNYRNWLSDCQDWWMCDATYRGDSTARKLYQKGNANAIALSLYEALLHDPRTPAQVKEKTIYMEAMTLAAQALYFEPEEAQTIHPLPGVVASIKKKVPYYEGDTQYYLRFDVWGDYQRRIDQLTTQMQRQFPKSSYIDDLLMANYHLSGQKRYLAAVIKQYPKGDRAQEAQFLFKHPKD